MTIRSIRTIRIWWYNWYDCYDNWYGNSECWDSILSNSCVYATAPLVCSWWDLGSGIIWKMGGRMTRRFDVPLIFALDCSMWWISSLISRVYFEQWDKLSRKNNQNQNWLGVQGIRAPSSAPRTSRFKWPLQHPSRVPRSEHILSFDPALHLAYVIAILHALLRFLAMLLSPG